MESTQRYGESSSSVKVLLSLEEPARKTRSVSAAPGTATLQRLRADPGTGGRPRPRQRTAAPPPCSTCAEISEPFPSIYSTFVKDFKRIIRTPLSAIFCIAVAKPPFTKVVRKIICSRLMFLSCACESRYTDPHRVPLCLLHRSSGAHTTRRPADAPGSDVVFPHKEVESRSAGTGGRCRRWAEFPPAFKALQQTSVAIPAPLSEKRHAPQPEQTFTMRGSDGKHRAESTARQGRGDNCPSPASVEDREGSAWEPFPAPAFRLTPVPPQTLVSHSEPKKAPKKQGTVSRERLQRKGDEAAWFVQLVTST